MTARERTFWRLVERAADRHLLGRAVSLLRELIAEHDAVSARSARRGRARGGGQSSKSKGREGAQMAQALIVETLGLQPDDVLVKATSMGGVDLHLSPHAQSVLPYGVESKRVESLNVWEAMAQAEVNATKKGVDPVVFFSRAHSPLYVALPAKSFLLAIKRATCGHQGSVGEHPEVDPNRV
jgi:hypothetical protein